MDLRRLFLSGFTRFVATLTCALYRPESRALFSWDIHKRLELKLFLISSNECSPVFQARSCRAVLVFLTSKVRRKLGLASYFRW